MHTHILSSFKDADHPHARCLSAALARAETSCAKRGLRLTKLRRRVLELVWGSHEPVKAYDILDHLRAEHRGAAPPTVYRALGFLQAHGFVHKIESLNAYFGCAEPGHRDAGQFLICRKCGEVAELDDQTVTALLLQRAAALSFDVEHQTIEIAGLCAQCRPRGEGG